LSACAEEPAPPAEPASGPVASTCGDRGYLQAELSGALTASVDWTDAMLRCESMLRPDDRGVRLRFSGDVGGERLAIIVAIPDLEAGTTGADIDAVVTVTVEGSGRFFSTPNLGACWADIDVNDLLPEQPGNHVVAGALACVGPLGEFNGDAFVELRNVRFSGIASWGTP
jgi:hypothetical protein